MVGLALRTLLLVLALAMPAAAAPEVAARDARLTVEIDPLPATPFEGEMILITVRGLYDVTVGLERLVQPDLRNFGWVQLGRDSWTTQRIEGRQLTVYERRLALYPETAGDLTIAPFIHRLTLVAANGERFVHDVVSPPVTVKVDPRPATIGGWWLPARSLTYSDEWDRDPAMLANGETATRTVRIEATGVPANALPPPPKMLAPWLISFIAPEQRSVELTENGPVSTVVWKWRMRPVSSEPGRLEAFHIPWFDTSSRQMRDVVLNSQRIAFAAMAEPPASGVAGFFVANAALLAGAGSFLAVLALGLPGRRLRSRAELARLVRRVLPDRDARMLRRAARRGDLPASRRAASGLAARSAGAQRAARRQALFALDRHLYGREPAAAGFDLKAFVRSMLGRRPTAGERPAK
ncbi:hypothetical protein [Aurantimonas sp. HBX-1]|uniref:hypothetical protein n=1 Tax=Aurantimonas sp. HBX-1 TaxID=2906072 RepID=UPI001F23C46C|nr:hypothetical protein [Aurantimonas sp. HBX-1]UIJ73170.1 hypothetical protein LXB15_05865 [Aurantimonas sp. HBX-1]